MAANTGRLTWEKWYPLLFGVIGGLAGVLLRDNVKVPADQRMALLSSMITAASVLFGFIGTVIAIVATFLTHRVMKALAALGADKLLYQYMFEPLYSLSLLIVLSMVATFSWGRAWWIDIPKGHLNVRQVSELDKPDPGGT